MILDLPNLNYHYNYRYNMYDDLGVNHTKEQLDFLLDLSMISQDQESPLNDFSISRDKLNLSQKERTREESYEDIMKQIHHTKLERIDLNKQLELIKRECYHTYLQQFQQEFRVLNQKNIKLRQELGKPVKKYNEDRCERYSNRSSIKMRKSIKSSYGDENQKTNTKIRKNHVSPNNLLKKDAKLAQSTANLGRSQIQSPKRHKKRESQLTQRKVQENNSIGVSVNISILDEKFDSYNIKQSVSKEHLRIDSNPQKNIFVQILENILNQEKQYQEERYGEIQRYLPPAIEDSQKREVILVNQLEAEIKDSHQKLEMLTLILSQYQKDMAELNINLKNASEWTNRLWQVKGKYIQMQKKCYELSSLRKQVSDKQEKLNKLKHSHIITQQQKSIPSIQTMIKVLSNSSKQFSDPSKLYMRYYTEIKQLFKFDKEEQTKRYSKIIKVKQTIDGIREGRKKFNELIHIYESRIIKLEQKITKAKTHNQKR